MTSFNFSLPHSVHDISKSDAFKLDSGSEMEFTFRSPLTAVELNTDSTENFNRRYPLNLIMAEGKENRFQKLDTSQPMDSESTAEPKSDKRIFGGGFPLGEKPDSSLIEQILKNRVRFIPEQLKNRLIFEHPPTLKTTMGAIGDKRMNTRTTHGACAKCTLNNDGDAAMCVVCETPKIDENSTSTSLTKAPFSSWLCEICFSWNEGMLNQCATPTCSALRNDRIVLGNGGSQTSLPPKHVFGNGQKQRFLKPKKIPLGLRSVTMNYLRDNDKVMDTINDKPSIAPIFNPSSNSSPSNDSTNFKARIQNLWRSSESVSSYSVKRKSTVVLEEPTPKIVVEGDSEPNIIRPKPSEMFTCDNPVVSGCTSDMLIDSPQRTKIEEEGRLKSLQVTDTRLTPAQQFSSYWEKRKKPPENCWECPTCSINNKNACCKTSKPGCLQIKSSSTSPMVFGESSQSSLLTRSNDQLINTAVQTTKIESSNMSTQSSSPLEEPKCDTKSCEEEKDVEFCNANAKEPGFADDLTNQKFNFDFPIPKLPRGFQCHSNPNQKIIKTGWPFPCVKSAMAKQFSASEIKKKVHREATSSQRRQFVSGDKSSKVTTNLPICADGLNNSYNPFNDESSVTNANEKTPLISNEVTKTEGPSSDEKTRSNSNDALSFGFVNTTINDFNVENTSPSSTTRAESTPDGTSAVATSNLSQFSSKFNENLPSFVFGASSVVSQNNCGSSSSFSANSLQVSPTLPSFTFGTHSPLQQSSQFGTPSIFSFGSPQNSTAFNQNQPSFNFGTNTKNDDNKSSTPFITEFGVNPLPVVYPAIQQNQLATIGQSQTPYRPPSVPNQISPFIAPPGQIPKWPTNTAAVNKSASSFSFGESTTTQRIRFADNGKSCSSFTAMAQNSTKSWNSSLGSSFNSHKSTVEADFSDSKFQLRRSTSAISMSSVPSDMSIDLNKSPRQVGMEVDKPSSPFIAPSFGGKRKYSDIAEGTANNSTYSSIYTNKNTFHNSTQSIFATSTTLNASTGTTNFFTKPSTSMSSSSIRVQDSFQMKNPVSYQSKANSSTMSHFSSFSTGSSDFATRKKDTVQFTTTSSSSSSFSSFSFPIKDQSILQNQSSTFFAKSTLSVTTSISRKTEIGVGESPLKKSMLESMNSSMSESPKTGSFNVQTPMALVPLGVKNPFAMSNVVPHFNNPFNTQKATMGNMADGMFNAPNPFGLPQKNGPAFGGGFQFNDQQAFTTQFGQQPSLPEVFKFNAVSNANFNFKGGHEMATNPSINPMVQAANNNEAPNPFVPTPSRPVLRAVRRLHK